MANITFVRVTHSTIFKNSHPEQITPLLSICYCASILEHKGHKVKLIDTFTDHYTLKKLFEKIRSNHPDVLVIDTITTTSKLCLELAEKVKETLNIPILLMGQHPTVLPETFLFKNTPIDVCIIGEPEITISELLGKLENKGYKKVNGIAFFDKRKNRFIKTRPRRLISNLDVLPFPKHSLYMNGKYNFHFPMLLRKKMKIGFMLTSRGCPYNCIFCSPALRVSYGKKYRARTAKNVVDEIEYLISEFGVNAIYFQDDNFLYDSERVKRICNEIIKRKLEITWSAQGRVDNINKNLARMMKKAGCSSLSFGVESGSERILKILKKGTTKKQIRKAFKILKETGILTNASFMIGCPTETMEEMKETLKFAKELQPDIVQVHIFTPYPGSSIFRKLDKNIIPDFEKFTHYNDVTINLSSIPSKEVKRFHKSFYREYYLNPRFFAKYIRYRLPYAIFNIEFELSLVKSALRFIFQK
jgi:radical SAM superfamily enzyme YgiQ (UPF0313 family)